MRSTTAAPRPAMIAVRRWAGVSPEAATPTATALSPARVRSISSTWSRTTRSWIRGAWSAAVSNIPTTCVRRGRGASGRR